MAQRVDPPLGTWQDHGDNTVDRAQSTGVGYGLFKVLRSLHRSTTKVESHHQENIDENREPTKEHDGRKGNTGSLLSFMKIHDFLHFIRKKLSAATRMDSAPNAGNLTPMRAPDPEDSVCEIRPLSQMASIPEIYSRLLLTRRHGYPLYQPEPDLYLPPEYRKRGTSIGDVGIVTQDGSFDFLFNVCSSRANINPHQLPENFEQLPFDDFSFSQYLPPETHLSSGFVTKINNSPATYTCSGHEGVVLELPRGALLYEARDKHAFRDLAARHAQDWYRYMIINKARDAPNGSLYLVTGCVKARDWGTAIFDRPSGPQDSLCLVSDEPSVAQDRNVRPAFSWRKTGAVITKIGPSSEDLTTEEGEEPNQCLFLRGYRTMLRQQIWDALVNGGSASSGKRTNAGDQTEPCGSDSAATPKQDEGPVILIENPGRSLIHPSDLVNAMLLQLESRAKVALAHDDDWCAILPNQFATKNSLKVGELCRSLSKVYMRVVDDYGSVSLIEK